MPSIMGRHRKQIIVTSENIAEMGWLEEGDPEECQIELAGGLREIGHPKPVKTGDQLWDVNRLSQAKRHH